MQATGRLEEVLAFAKEEGKVIERTRINGQGCLPGVYGSCGIDGIEGSFATDAAAGAGVEMALQFFQVGVGPGIQGDADGVLAVCVFVFRALVFRVFPEVDGFRFEQGGVAGDNVFGEQEAEGQFEVLAGGAHGNGYGLFGAFAGGAMLQYDLQRLLHDYGVMGVEAAVCRDLLDGQVGDAG